MKEGNFITRIMAIFITAALLIGVVLCFAGCSSSTTSGKLSNKDTELLAYENIGGVAQITGIGAYPSTDLIIPEEIGGLPVVSVGEEAFEDSRITSVIIADTVTEINDSAFYGCENLTSVSIGKGVTKIKGFAFEDCDNLKAVYINDLSAWCGIMFSYESSNPLYYAHNLYINGDLATDIVIPDDVTAIENHAFCCCSNLTSVTIGNSLEEIGYFAFDGCDNLTTVIIPDGAANINVGIFRNFSYLTTIEVFENNEYYSVENGVLFNKDKTELFFCCRGISCAYTIPDSVEYICRYAFEGCKNLTSIIIPDSVEYIGEYAFEDCKNLTSLTIPDSISCLEYNTFIGCNNLTSVSIPQKLKYDFAQSFIEDGLLGTWYYSLPEGIADDFTYEDLY